MKIIKLGSFNISEEKIVVAAPSYDYGDSGTVLLKKVLSGKYYANVTTADNLITTLKICHSDYKNCDLKFEQWTAGRRDSQKRRGKFERFWRRFLSCFRC